MTSYAIEGASVLGEEATRIVVTDGVIAGVGAHVEAPREAERIDAEGLIALPGLVDLHTHLREPGQEDAETVYTGTRAAAAGGFTCVHAMANTTPVADNASVVEQVAHLGREAGFVDVRPVGAVSENLEGKHLAAMGAMAASDAK